MLPWSVFKFKNCVASMNHLFYQFTRIIIHYAVSYKSVNSKNLYSCKQLFVQFWMYLLTILSAAEKIPLNSFKWTKYTDLNYDCVVRKSWTKDEDTHLFCYHDRHDKDRSLYQGKNRSLTISLKYDATNTITHTFCDAFLYLLLWILCYNNATKNNPVFCRNCCSQFKIFLHQFLLIMD